MGTQNICFYYSVAVIQMSAHNILFYKENQNKYHISIIQYASKEVFADIPLKWALIRKIFYYIFSVIWKNLSAQCSNWVEYDRF